MRRAYKKYCESITFEKRLGTEKASKLRAERRERRIAYNTSFKGSTYEERYGKEKGTELRIKMKTASWFNTDDAKQKASETFTRYNISNKGKTFEEIYGTKRAVIRRQQCSVSGEKNGMYGKPSPKGSGNGWSGWYKDWYFRSLKELSFMINYIEANNLEWESGEKKEYRIEYVDPITSNSRTYHPDFRVGDRIIEIKPKNLLHSLQNKTKFEAAKIWCNKNGFKHIVFTEEDYKQLTNEEIVNLYNTNTIKWLSRYEQKFKELPWIKT